MSSRQFHKTKASVKLPKDIKKGSVVSAYSTNSDVTIEGYTGKIELINSKEVTADMLLCRPDPSNQRKAWVKICT